MAELGLLIMLCDRMSMYVDFDNERAMRLMILLWFLRRAYTRSVLKQQIDDNSHTERQSRVTRNLESVVALEKDRRDRDEDARNFRNKFNYLKTFRDENKKVRTMTRNKLPDDVISSVRTGY